MYWISEGREIKFLEAKEKINFDAIVNTQRFTVKDTPLSYRQINSLDQNSLINENRTNKKGWRKFNFKELAYILIVQDLRKYGFNNLQLKELSKYFLDPKLNYLSDLMIGCVFAQVEITITIDSNGTVNIFDPGFYELIGADIPHVRLRLNDYINKIARLINKPEFPIKYSIKSEALNSTSLTPKEEELLKIIRNTEYSSIKIKKSNGSDLLVHAEKKHISRIGNEVEELLNVINSKDYQDINIIKRDGKIVNYKIEETIKL